MLYCCTDRDTEDFLGAQHAPNDPHAHLIFGVAPELAGVGMIVDGTETGWRGLVPQSLGPEGTDFLPRFLGTCEQFSSHSISQE